MRAVEDPVTTRLHPELHALEEAGFVVGGVVLVFAVEGVVIAGADFHQAQQRAHGGPADDGALVHGCLVLAIEGIGDCLAVVDEQLFPLLPQVHAIWPADNGLEFLPDPQRVLVEAVGDRVVMQDGVEVEHVHATVGRAEREDYLFHPGFDLVALLLAAHVLVVLDVVQQDQVGTVRAVAQAAHFLAGAECLDLDVVGSDDDAGIPDTAASGGIRVVHEQARIALQLDFDGCQHAGGLVEAVHDDGHEVLAGGNDAPQGRELGAQGGLGLATGRADVDQVALGGVDVARHVVKVPAVEQAGFALDVMREVGTGEEFEVVVGAGLALVAGVVVGGKALALGFDQAALLFSIRRQLCQEVLVLE